MRDWISRNRLYRHTDISDRFSLEAVQIPCVIIRGVSNSQKRVSYQDFIDDVTGRVELIPITADDNLFGNNVQSVNLPDNVTYDPRWPWDNSIGVASGVDINNAIYTSGTITNSGINTGIIITVPGSGVFDPTSIVTATEYSGAYYGNVVSGNNLYNLALSLNQNQDQFYLIVSGTDIMISGVPSTGSVALPVEPNQFIVDGSGVAPGLTGTQLLMSDVLYAGDQYILKTFDKPHITYEIYGGIYNISVSIECYARTTIEAQELGDLIQRFLVERKLNFYDQYGVSITSWSQGGQSEREYVNEHIFQTAISSEMFIEWHNYKSVDLISSFSGIAIPFGNYYTNYSPPSVYTKVVPYLNGSADGDWYYQTGLNETQALYYDVSGTSVSPTGGYFYLTYTGSSIATAPTGSGIYQQTGPLAYNISNIDLITALQGLSNIGTGNIIVNGQTGINYNMTFINALSNMPLPLISVSGSGIDAGITPTIVEVTQGHGIV
jgi:hypothetical protein